MGWSLGFDKNWNRWVGYGVPAYCDHEGCDREIDRGLGYVCGGEVFGGEDGCGLYFCSIHLFIGMRGQQCERCTNNDSSSFAKSKEHPIWIGHILNDESWKAWRIDNPDEVEKLEKLIGESL